MFTLRKTRAETAHAAAPHGRPGPAHTAGHAPAFRMINNKGILGEKSARKFSHLINLHSMKPRSIDPNRAIEIRGLVSLILRDIEHAEIAVADRPEILAEVEQLRKTGIFAPANAGTKIINPTVLDTLKTAQEDLGRFGSHLKKAKAPQGQGPYKLSSAADSAVPSAPVENAAEVPGRLRKLLGHFSMLIKPRLVETASAKVEASAKTPVANAETPVETTAAQAASPEPESAVTVPAPAVPEKPKITVEQLIKELNDPKKRHDALDILNDMRIGPEEAVPGLIDVLHIPIEKETMLGLWDLRSAINILGTIGAKAREASPRLMEILMEMPLDGYTFHTACNAMREIDRENASTVFMSYLRLLQRPEKNRQNAAFLIALDFYTQPEKLAANLRDPGILAFQRRMIMSELIGFFRSLSKRDSVASVRSTYSRHLELIVPVLREMFESPDLALGEMAAKALEILGPFIRQNT